jgi:hypothetical protein
MHSIAFVLSVCVCQVGSVLEHTGYIRTHACRSVCEIGRCARTNASEFERRPVSAIKHTGYVRMHSANFILLFFLYKNNYTQKIFTTNTQIKIFTHIFT